MEQSLPKIVISLLLALPLEGVNFLFGGLALDPGNIHELPWYKQVIGFEWGVLHAPGILAADWISRAGVAGHDGLVVLIAGYLVTAVLIAVFLAGVERLRRTNLKSERA